MSRYFTVQLCPEAVFQWTLWIIAALVAANLLAVFMALELGNRRLLGLADLVNLNMEQNFPTVFSQVQLLAAGALAWQAGTQDADLTRRRLWRFLGLGLVWIGLDEAIAIHERANKLDIGGLGEISYFYFPWVVPALLVVAVCGAIMLKLLLTLPRSTAVALAWSGGLFVAGSVGMELLGGHQAELHGYDNWTYVLCYTLEETLEMLAVALFIRTVLHHMLEVENIPVRIEKTASASQPV
jgi:hypothetical protein